MKTKNLKQHKFAKNSRFTVSKTRKKVREMDEDINSDDGLNLKEIEEMSSEGAELSDEITHDKEQVDDDNENDSGNDELLKKIKPAELDSEGSDEDWLNADLEHKKSLQNLRLTDPELFDYLIENDEKLLDFNVSDDSEDDEDEKYHVPPQELEVASDESDYEQDVKRSGKFVTLAVVRSCREKLINEPSVNSIRQAVELFHAALHRVTGEDASQYVVEGSAVFNAIMELCVVHLHSAIIKFLKLAPQHAKDPSKSKKWVKIKSLLQSYFTDLFKILEGVASEHIITVLLKHLHALCNYVTCFQKLSKSAIKYLTKLWSTGEELVRVLAFLCILRLTTVVQKTVLLNNALKLMYIAFIKGSKFVSANTLPQVNFMKQTLVTLFTINPSLSYQHAFLYIRQLAIHLRNAITIHKKETFQTVYNWQYILSLRLWVDLMCSSKESTDIQQLLYPLVQIILGCVRLIPTAQYLPLRFHCNEMLIKLSRELDIFIPVLPLILEALTCADLNKTLKKASMKPFDFTFILRLSKAAMTETGFTDAIVENVFEQLVEMCTIYSHSITYPDVVVPTIVQLKSFIKDCRTPKYSSKLKQALLKIEENYKYLNNERNKLNINLHDKNKIKAFELDIKSKSTPLEKYWQQYKKSQNLVKGKRVADENAKMNDMGIPKMKKFKVGIKDNESVKEEPVELFPSDEESDVEFLQLDDEDIEEKEKKRNKKKSKRTVEDVIKSEEEEEQEKNIDEPDDLVEELNINTF